MAYVDMEMHPNRIVQYLGKLPKEFTKADIIKFIKENDIRLINFRHVGGDGRIKTLNFVITGERHLDLILSAGERVDGSSLFSYIDAASSDLYIIPRFNTAYVNPFTSIPTVDILCSYYTSEGLPLPSAPENIVRTAHTSLKQRTGLDMEAAGELEYFVLFDRERLYTTTEQRGYLESSPFCKQEQLRCEAMQAMAQVGGKVKYGHSELGHIFQDELEIEQNEIEFVPMPIEDAADQVALARWVLRMVGYRHGLTISFIPKIMVGHAGNGFHIHTRLIKNGKNMMVDENALSDTARKTIAGYLTLSPSLTAFGNTIPLSFLRLVPQQEAPTNICWGDRNRSVLVRVPLGWLNVGDMVKDANPQDTDIGTPWKDTQTVEFRCPDGSANVHHLLAGLAVAAEHGLGMKNALQVAKKLYVDVNIFSSEHKGIRQDLPQLPTSCGESAECLLKDRKVYEKHGVFPPMVIDGLAKQLQSYDDRELSEKHWDKGDEIKKLVQQYFHY
ncbi:MAG: glutamine synthetase family protein [Chloroflexota bacterium]|nr:glutamine synthetase family protein [Chloroflexota bacterium]